MRIGTNELLIILVVVLLIFGPKNLPKSDDEAETTTAKAETTTAKAETKTEKKDDEE